MPRFRITLNVEAASLPSLHKKLKGLVDADHVLGAVRRANIGGSRADRFVDVLSQLSDVHSGAEELRDELQEWRDNLPENLQSGSKAEELDDAISQLEEFMEQVNSLEDHDVSFPGMR